VSYSFRIATQEDAAFIGRLFSLPHVAAFLNAPSPDAVGSTIADAGADVYIIRDGTGSIGNLVLRNHGFLVDVSIIAVAAPRRGVGSCALEFALRRAFEELAAHRAFLEVREDNVAMRALAERFGFVQEGTYRDGFFDERTQTFHNLCPYGLLENDYRRRVAESAGIIHPRS
jgi:RimJ/RimL family protein N-acetyltransferase